ncbi:MAG: sulfatase-like hydrolase/transferase [Verrucomicrobiae bacterium]|nr:sulfatase-like hydrolase/transferase [Verrucomicrobiae bacterium]NNJ43719.1 sulfatase-like hydrolase/transferase [Akkermansiaceae bacterium]
MHSNQPPAKGWHTFRHHLGRDSKLWLWIIFLLFISRMILVWQNRHSITDDTPFSSYALAFFTGFRFDMPVATIFVLPSFLCACLGTLVPTQQTTHGARAVITYLFTILWVIITTVTLGYFKEYHNQFDANLLGVVYDDFDAIVKTIWTSYPVVIGSLVMIVISAGLIFLGRRWIRAPFPLRPPMSPPNIIARIGLTLLLLVMLAIGLRGSLGRRPMQQKDASRTKDLVLNRCIINPFSSLNYAIKSHKELMTGDGLDSYLKKENLLTAFHEYAGNQNIENVDDAFRRTAKGRPGEKPRHIFLLVMESYDGWTMFDPHADWNIANELKQLGEDGIYVKHFLPGSRSTMTSLATIIGGMADAGVISNERSRPTDPAYPTAIASQMKKLGYQTHLWYAGYGGWARIEDFCKEQGFDHTHTGSSMDQGHDTNEWGVSDERLFSYMKEQLNPDQPTFNLVLSSSNHPPYSLDMDKVGCPLASVPTAYENDFQNGSASLHTLGHHWYSDKWMGDFVRSVSSKVPGCLFAITGDHWSRKFPGPRPIALERATVPLVLYGSGVLPENLDEKRLRGSHYDLGATLIELAADPGFGYHAIGRNILDPKEGDVAMSRLWIIGDNAIMAATRDKRIETLDGQHLDTLPSELKAAKRRYKLTHGISWWRLRKGNDLPKE